ncbi:DUF1294 domain-containing protein [Acuticoccus kandeliae]|uniref:DUF1294 domain-containing protein n=1 Tax=Acuticoccus kandeliae TaxID=2073160 RepID=UPI000D3E28BE|nr:DUF1294 domain-containing protein [Acuticoccus kandeliae]
MTVFLLFLAWLLLISVVGFAVFAADKRAAIADRRRVPERVLLTLAALGAAPAMVAGASLIRHKTRKQPFRGLLLAILVLQAAALLAVLAWWLGLV